MVKKNKKEQKETKDLIERTKEVVQLRIKFNEMGINSKQVPEFDEFVKILEEYRINGAIWSGNIKLHGTNRIISGFLTNSKGKNIQIKLNYDKNI